MELNKAIADHFDADELATLAAELGVELPEPPDPREQPAERRAAALLGAAGAAGRATDLMAALVARRPAVPWAELPYPAAALNDLHAALVRRLDLDGLRTLCFQLGVDFDSLPGEGKSARARELVLTMARAGRLAELNDAVRKISRKDAKNAKPRILNFAFFASLREPLLTLSLILLALLVAGLWWNWRIDRLWANGAPIPAEAVGVAVAEFAETADCRRGPRGREASALVYGALEREIAAAGLGSRVALTKVGRVCDAAAAQAAGERAGADLVVWGWLPESDEGLYGELTVVGAPPASADLAGSFAALLSGPGLEPSYRLSGRAAVLARFLVGLVHAGAGDPARAAARFSEAIDLVETGPDAAELGETLAVLLTERGKSHVALGDLDAAAADYARAESLSPHSVRLLINLAGLHYLRRDWDAAEEYLDRAALHHDEPLPNVAYGYGLLDYYRGDYAAAAAHFDEAIALSEAAGQRPVTVWLARGYSYVNMGRCDTAAPSFRAVLDAQDAPAGLRAAAGTELARCRVASDERRVTSDERGVTSDEPVTVSDAPATSEAGEPVELPVVVVALDPPPAGDHPTPTPDLQATPTAGPLYAQVSTRGANVRQGPGAEYAVMVTRRTGAQMEVVAMSLTGEWLQVRVPGRGRGWVSSAYVELLGDPSAIAAATAAAVTATPAADHRPPAAGGQRDSRPSITPSPTATPTPAGRPTGGALWPTQWPTPAPPDLTQTPPAPPGPTQTPAWPPTPPPTLLPPPTAIR